MKYTMKTKWIAVMLALCFLPGCTANVQTSAESAASKTASAPVEEKKDFIPEIDRNREVDFDYHFSGGDGSKEDPFKISNAEDLHMLRVMTSYRVKWNDDAELSDIRRFCEGYYALTDDISLNDGTDFESWKETPPENVWIPVGYDNSVQIHFDGAGHTISGMFMHTGMELNGCKDIGLFSKIDQAEISDLKLQDSLIVLENSEKIMNVGGLAGEAYSCIITNCESGVQIIAADDFENNGYQIGGLIGGCHTDISDCAFTGAICARNSDIGGIAGLLMGSVAAENLESSGTISVPQDSDAVYSLGGVFGSVLAEGDCRIIGCMNRSNILAGREMYVGGIAGIITTDREYRVHLHEDAEQFPVNFTISDCKNYGNIESFAEDAYSFVGGIAGHFTGGTHKEYESMTICDLENCGMLSSTGSAAGIFGQTAMPYFPINMERCRNSGSVEAVGAAGGIIAEMGFADYSIRNCENLAPIHSEASSCAGIIAYEFGFDTRADESAEANALLSHCRNSGEISHGSGCSSVGGIFGEAKDSAGTIRIEYCQNEGVIRAEDAGKLGGIVGGDLLSLSPEIPHAIEIVSCVNTGDLILGGGEQCFDESASEKTYENPSATENLLGLAMLGSTNIGGIMGYSKSGLVQDCVNLGAIYLPENADVYLGTDSEDPAAFCGGIVGFLNDSSKNSEAKPEIVNCLYSEPSPWCYTGIGFFSTEIQPVDAATAQNMAEMIIEQINAE